MQTAIPLQSPTACSSLTTNCWSWPKSGQVGSLKLNAIYAYFTGFLTSTASALSFIHERCVHILIAKCALVQSQCVTQELICDLSLLILPVSCCMCLQFDGLFLLCIWQHISGKYVQLPTAWYFVLQIFFPRACISKASHWKNIRS